MGGEEEKVEGVEVQSEVNRTRWLGSRGLDLVGTAIRSAASVVLSMVEDCVRWQAGAVSNAGVVNGVLTPASSSHMRGN